ncbi:MAG: hypothetical protein ACOYLX_23375, partial [Burkholderiaceae bacterium]
MSSVPPPGARPPQVPAAALGIGAAAGKPPAPTGEHAAAPAQTGEVAAAPARELAAQIGREIEAFKAGKVSWKTLDTLRRLADEITTRGVVDPAAERALEAQAARIPQQGRSLGDDTGWDAVELVKTSIREAQWGRIGAPDLTRALDLAQTAHDRHAPHWAPGARINFAELEQAARSGTLPLLAGRDKRVADGLRDAQQAWQRSASPAALNMLLQRRAEAVSLLERNTVDPARRAAVEAAVQGADVALARGRTQPVDAALERALRAWREAPDTARRTELNHRLAEAREVRRVAGWSQDKPAMVEAAAALVALPPVGTVRYRDVDPDGPAGSLRATYVGVPQRDGSLLQTRVRARETHVGDDRWEREFEAQGVSWRSADGNRYSERPGRTYPLQTPDGGPLATPAQAVARAREMLRSGAISTSDAPDAAARQANAAIRNGPFHDGRFQSQGVLLPDGLGRLGNPYVAELRGLLDRSVAPNAQRYLAG